jgi:DNA polymerase-3 subunit delta'
MIWILDQNVPRLDDIRGQDRAIARLRSALATGRVHHAYLFTGAPGSGKRATALALAGALNCQREPGIGCDSCDACLKIAAGIHPDVVTLEREGAAQIVPIETIRQQVIARVGLPPHEGNMRVFLIDEATALQPAAANSLLKTLEEPPSRTMFVLGTVAPDQLLPTIRSRCQRIAFVPVAGDEPGAERVDGLAEDIATFAGDGPLGGAAIDRVVSIAAKVNEEKGAAAVVLDLAARRLHDAARAAVGRDEVESARVMGERARLVLETWLAITMHNAQAQLALEALLGRLWHLNAKVAA